MNKTFEDLGILDMKWGVEQHRVRNAEETDDFLAHYGIPGQKHGVRRYQYEDGTYTPEGKERYASDSGSSGVRGRRRTTTTVQGEDVHKTESVNQGKAPQMTQTVMPSTTPQSHANLSDKKSSKMSDDEYTKTKQELAKRDFVQVYDGNMGKMIYIKKDEFRDHIKKLASQGIEVKMPYLDSSDKSDDSMNDIRMKNAEVRYWNELVEKAQSQTYTGPESEDILTKDDEKARRKEIADRKAAIKAKVEEHRKKSPALIQSDDEEDSLQHYGILGMKWGVRRYQNKDGTWTKEGKEHRAESNNTSFSEKEQKQNMKEYADVVGEYWKGVREHKSDLDLLDQVTESSPIIKAVRQTEEYGEYADSIKAYQDYMKDNFTNNPENQQKAREFVAQKYIDDPVYDEINNYQDAVNYLGESYLNDDLYAVYQHNIDPKAGALYDSMWAKYDKAKSAADKVEEQYIGEIDYDNYKGKIRSGLDRPAGLALLGLPVMRLNESDETKHSDDSTEDSLMHYGILGMKWGIRRFQNKDGSLTAAGRKRYGDDIPDGNKSSSGDSSNSTPRTPAKSASEMTDQELNQALNRLRMEQQYNELTGAKSSNQYQNQQNFQSPPSNTNALSNAELQAYINRLNMEKQYKQLTTPPPKELTWGQKFVKEALPAVAMEVAKEFTKKTMKKLLGIDDGGSKDNDDSGKKKEKKKDNKNSLNEILNKINQSDKRIDSMMSKIDSLNKNTKALPEPSSEKTESQKSSVSKGFIKRMKNAVNDELKREQQYNKDLRSGKYTPVGESVANDYSTIWFYDVNRDY